MITTGLETIDKIRSEIADQREEILKAFLAKYKVQPEECEQIIENTPTGIRWYVRKKSLVNQ